MTKNIMLIYSRCFTHRFSEIEVCLGKPYVYIHNGDCQHHVIVNDLRIHSSLKDDPERDHYPMLLGSFVHKAVSELLGVAERITREANP